MRISSNSIWKILAFVLVVFKSCDGLENHMPGTLHRQLRELRYPDDSEMGLFFALAIPLDDPVSTKAMSVAFFFEANYGLVESSGEKESRETRAVHVDRRTFYKMLESKFQDFGLPGRTCLLRFICETNQRQIPRDNGLIGDLLRILLTPSSSVDEGLSAVYMEAERQANTPDDCGTTYSLCSVGIYDYITSTERFFWLFGDTKATLKDNKRFDINGLLRKKRYLVYPNPLESETKVQVLFGLGLPMEEDITTILGYVLKFNYNLPYNGSGFTEPYIRYQRNINENEESLSRWSLYRLLVTAMEAFGSGRVCLLRAICETAETPFGQSLGPLGELFNVLLTPSSTSEKHQAHEDHEYYSAESMGKEFRGACSRIFSECIKSPLDYFTDLSFETVIGSCILPIV